MSDRAWSFGCAAVLAGLAAAPVQVVVATEYLSLEAAQKALFPQADEFREVVLALSAEQRYQVAALAGPQPPHRSIRAFRALQGRGARRLRVRRRGDWQGRLHHLCGRARCGRARARARGAGLSRKSWRRDPQCRLAAPVRRAPGSRPAAGRHRHQEHRRRYAVLRARDAGRALAGGTVAGGAGRCAHDVAAAPVAASAA